VTCSNGVYRIVPDLPINDFSRKRMDLSAAELREERDGVRELLGG
jgi:malate dehydrogenase